MVKRGLGRGLGALLPQKEENEDGDKIIASIAIDKIVAGQHQPRKDIDKEKLEELAQSILNHGVIQPIVVKPIGSTKYEIVAGERRWRACQLAGIKEIPAIIKQINARETAEIALIENLQRENLNQLEEAEAYQKLIEQHKVNQEEIARRVGKSRPVIANALRLLQLPAGIKDMLRKNEITTGHAKVIMSLKEERKQLELANLIREKGLTVRETENIIKQWEKKKRKRRDEEKEKIDPESRELEEKLQQIFTTRVKLKQGQNNGRIEIYYYSQEELDRILTVLLNRDVPRGTI